MQLARKALFFATILAVAGYAIGVLIHLRSSSSLGVRTLFSDYDLDRSSVAGPLVRWANPEAESVGADTPERGDRLIRVAGEPVPTILHFERRLDSIRPPARLPADANVEQAADLLKLPKGVDWADVAGQRWARVAFQRPGDLPSAPLHQAWLRLEPTSRAAMLASLAWFLLEMVILLIGALVMWKRPGDPSAGVFFALCTVNVVAFVGGFHWPDLTGSRLLAYPFVLCALLLAPMTLHFYALFPRPLPWVRRAPATTVGLLYAVPAVWIVLTFYNLVRVHQLLEDSRPPSDFSLPLERLGSLFHIYLAISGAMFLAGFAVLRHKYVHGRTQGERNQLKWLLGAALVATVPLLYLLWTALRDRGEFAFAPLPKVALYVISLVFTLAYAVSITRYKLMQVGQILNRGLVYVGISFAATALFCSLVGVTTALVGSFYFRWENAAMAGMTAMLVVVSLGWIRDRLQRAIDRRFYREKYQLDQAVRRLSAAVEQLVEPAQLARQLAQSVRDSTGGQRAAVYLRDDDATLKLAYQADWAGSPEQIAGDATLMRELATRGYTADRRLLRAWDARLAYLLESDGTALGLLLLGPKEDGSAYSFEDRNFLLALARTAALALRGAQGYRTIDALKDQLQEKVQKLAEQQRRIMYLQSELLNRQPGEQPPAEAGTRSTINGVNGLKHEIRGSSPIILRLLEQLAKVAQSPSSVLIRGESGTGKELIARAIHVNSPRAAGAFVQVHCAALSPGLLESELFGHVKGAFTGADRDKIGRFEMANGGTLFLDEVGDISLETQTKLLRVLQERAFERVGGIQTVQVDVRLIAATHQNLEELIRQGRFREDLFYRLNVISLLCPNLRQRREDIFELSLHFLHVYARQAGKNIVRIEEDALETLAAYHWPGNIRQLENAIERAVVLADGDSIGLSDLPPELNGVIVPAGRLRGGQRLERHAPMPVGVAITARDGLPEELSDMERERLVAALAQCRGNKAQAARLLGLPRSTLFSKLRKFGLES
jgi:transcriptional regulator with GAF, ATPase, and Fis domain